MTDAQLAAIVRPDGFLLTRDARAIGADRLIERARRDGRLVRLRTGVHMLATNWARLTPDQQYRAHVRAAALVLRKDAVFSHYSAASLWELPIIGPWPSAVHTITTGDAGGRSAPGIIRHTTSAVFNSGIRAGHAVTAVPRTVLDLAMSAPLASAAAAADRALRSELTTRDELQSELNACVSRRGTRQAKYVIDFADGAADNGGESLMRLQLRLLGFPPPRLQHAFFDADGHIGNTDADWPEYGVVLEFDGKQKYVNDEYTRGRSAADIVLAEKRREDRLRALGLRVVRITWADLHDPVRLARILEAAGVPRMTATAPMLRASA
ncbi:hypothetical protein ACL9RL_10185 [Plantibacter sp. Mn2098]|uniref:hypothetical protein n=1 Tax=Plantibacter sp. Mn2098 TaxID=3395266 RepID=UPI003BCABE8C